MKTIKLKFEYHCFPIWIYDENGHFVDNNLPIELSGDKDIEAACREAQLIYDNLFVDDGTVFEYTGFKDNHELTTFQTLVDYITDYLRRKISTLYIVESAYADKVGV